MWYFAKPLRKLRGRSITKIGDVSPGSYVRLSGTVGGVTDVVAPVSQSPCSLFELEMREWENGATYPFSKERKGEFAVRDESGAAWIDCSGAAVELRVDEMGNSLDDEVADNVTNYVMRLGRTMFDSWGVMRSLEWRERLLAPGDHVCIVGVAEHEAHPDGQPSSYRHSPSRVILRAELIVERRSCRCS